MFFFKRNLPFVENQDDNEQYCSDNKKIQAENGNGKFFSECTVKSD
jgi:hypothetical protein